MSKQAELRPLLIVALMGWLCWVMIVILVNPSTTLGKWAFFALLYIALTGSLSMVAGYIGSKRPRAKTYRGNLPYSLQQGGLWAAFFVVAAIMQANRAMSVITAIVLLALFGLAEVIVLTRR